MAGSKTTSKRRRRNLPPAGLLLTPGASADRNHSTLVALEEGLPELAVERLTLGTTSIKRAVTKVRESAESLAERLDVSPERIAYGGRSFGGRACSVAVAEGLPAAALVLLSYPLHPPGKPDNLRVEHFGAIAVPTLFLSGVKDPFGSADEFAAHTGAIESEVTMAWVPGNHAPKGQDETIVAEVRSFLGLPTNQG
ncbi:MAG: dienelactone hydrolase [Acidimicrobiia bacterium]|nr:dienelactone hydrolase [Acidimicrobiia bacterium]